MPISERRVLLLSVGYGEGHHSAAKALEEELGRRGWQTEMLDPCLIANPVLFPLTQRFYHHCVRSMPWLWRVTYAQTETTDWSRIIHLPLFRKCMNYLRSKLRSTKPNIIICTYPLFAYMVDAFQEEGWCHTPCVVVVTDALEISRPWLLSQAPLLCVTDEHSLALVQERYALDPARVAVTGFPVRADFHEPTGGRPLPGEDGLRIVYGAYAPVSQIVSDIHLVLQRYAGSGLHITLLAGERLPLLSRLLSSCQVGGRLTLLGHTDEMPDLFRNCHLYIGKAGAATLFEAYASVVPVIVNYALPGQEQGNLELLQRDGAGSFAEGTSELGQQLDLLFANGAKGWRRRCEAIRAARRSRGAGRVVDLIEKRFFG